MVSPAVNVVRYTALASGIIYGIVHRRTLTSREKQKQAVHEEHRQQDLLTRAREAWKEKNKPADTSLVTDPEDPKFDLEKLAAAFDKQ